MKYLQTVLDNLSRRWNEAATTMNVADSSVGVIVFMVAA
jgi:hypothetical protein